MTHQQVVSNFVEHKINKRTKTVEWRGSRVFCEDKTIYSYGRHFPLAVLLGQKEGKDFYLKNGDKYSSSTTGHQSMVQMACPGVTIPFSILRSAGIEWDRLKPEDVMDSTADYRETMYWSRDEKSYVDIEGHKIGTPKQGMFMGETWGDLKDGNFTSRAVPGAPHLQGEWHILGGTLIQYRKKYFLFSMDENQYFGAELSKPAKTITEAFNALKPDIVRKAEEEKIKVERQGEWFFIKTQWETDKQFAGFLKITQKFLKQNSKTRALSKTNADSNNHVARFIQLPQPQPEGTMYVSGTVRHRFPKSEWTGRSNRATGQHRPLKLDGWYIAARNTEVASWSAQGRVD